MSARFVLLHHECPLSYSKPSHWDFMLEHEAALLTWQLNVLPPSWASCLNLQTTAASEWVDAIRLPDHRLAYLEYEGPLSGDRGSVVRLDGGAFTWVEHAENLICVQLQGTHLSCQIRMSRGDEAWRLAVE